MAELPKNFEIPTWLYRRWIWHAAFWAVYFGLMLVQDLNEHMFQMHDYWKLAVITHLSSVVTVYSTTFWAVPYFFYKKKYLAFAVVCALLTIGLGYLITFSWDILQPKIDYLNLDYQLFRPEPLSGVATSALFILLSATLKIIKDMLIAAQQRADRDARNLRGELDALRHQISPHFLLNSLNTIYGQAITEPDSVAPTVLLLSDLLRFSLYETRSDRIALDREVGFLHDFVGIQRLRASEKLYVEIDFPPKLPNPVPEIAPLLLLVFVENGFKYAQTNAAGERFLAIKMRYDAAQNRLFFECSNSFSEYLPQDTGGVGLENVRRRLELIYPKNHALQIRAAAGVWSVQLEINLKP